MGSLTVDRISRYRLLRELGQTRLGHVYLSISSEDRSGAEKGRSPGFFCVELLNTSWAQDHDLRALFLDEAAQTLQLEHPNVVRTQEVIAEPTACGRVTRWFAGHSFAGLLERMGRAAFPLQLHVRVLCEVLSALQYLHELEDPFGASGGLVYRDASPERVFLTYTGQVKLLGAGFERTIDEIERRSGQMVADIGYASPELCLGYPPSPSGDVYSVGVMLWEALARARRSFADTPEASLRLRVSGEEPDVEQFRPGVPERLAQICRRALAVSPRDRYANAQELQIDLESFLADTETDAQQNAGLGALAQLMMQHFAAERAEMLTWIEQQLASPERPAEPGARCAASDPAAQTVSVAAAVAGPPESGPTPAASAATRPGPFSPAVLEPPELPELSPERWDEHTHNVTSFEELLPESPADEPVRLTAPELLRELSAPGPARDPDTNGHRAYSSTLQQELPSPSSFSRVAVPIALAAGVLLLVTQGVRLAQSGGGPPRDSASSAPVKRANERRDSSAREVAVRPLHPKVAPPEAVQPQALHPEVVHPEVVHPEALAPTPGPQPSVPQSENADAGVLQVPAFLEGAAQAAVPVSSARRPRTLAAPPAVPSPRPEAVAPALEPSMPTFTADALEPSVSRPAPKPRRVKPRPEARPDPRASRPSNVPRSIDETDPVPRVNFPGDSPMHQASPVFRLSFGSLLSSLALLFGLALHAAPSWGTDAVDATEVGAETDDARSSTIALARRHFLHGVEMYRAGAYDAALAAFTRAYELAPTYRILYNLAQVQAQRQDYVQALELFGRYLREGTAASAGATLPESRVAEVETEMTELKHRVAELRVETNVEGAILVVNESRVSKLPLATPLWLNAGIHRMRVEKPGHLPVTKIVTVAGGETPLVSFELERETFPIDFIDALPPPRGLHGTAPRDVAPAPLMSTAVGVGLVSTGILAATTAVCAVMTYRQSGALDRELSHYPEGLDDIESARSRLRTLAVLTNVFALASVAAAGVTTYFHLSTPRREPPRKTELGAGVGPDGVNLWLRGAL